MRRLLIKATRNDHLQPVLSCSPPCHTHRWPHDHKQGPQAAGSSFTERLGGAIDSLAESQNKATEAATAYEMGQQQDLAAVMIEQQVASLGFQLALNIRNKALSAYRDIMNMSV